MAYNHFANAVKYGHETGNTQLTNLAGFWQAECMYRTNDFAGSLHILNRLTGNSQFKGTAEYPTAIYNSGYNQFTIPRTVHKGSFFSTTLPVFIISYLFNNSYS